MNVDATRAGRNTNKSGQVDTQIDLDLYIDRVSLSPNTNVAANRAGGYTNRSRSIYRSGSPEPEYECGREPGR